jgi:CYTH domain-containing protein/transcriptional regulator with XRE-family HTH domain
MEEDMRDYKLGNKLYELRKKKNLTQEDLAILLDVSDKAVSKWENGTSKPTIINLKKLSEIFDVSLDELITLEEKENKQKITKIVLTGGPCAGKTTAMNWIQNFFQKQGYKIIFVPETATELITSGITPWEAKTNSDFESVLFDLQIAKEKLYEEGAKKLPNEKILMVFDRGLLDNKTYMSKRDFDYLLKSKRLSEVKLRDSYDAVFHLVTAAKGAKKYYNLDNAARTETIEEATKLDDSLIASWTGHSHFRIIDNSTDFETKMKRLLKEISNVLGEPEPYEIERKFLIEMPDLEYLESLPTCEKVQIVQTYLKSDENEEIRIRQRGKDSSFTYSKTRKINISNLKRIEIETRLTEEEYINELLNADPEKGQIIKTRYCLAYNNQYFEIDIYPFWKDKAIAEIELSDEKDKIDLPPFINLIDEVTDDFKYRNSEIAKQIKKGLEI